MFFWVNDISLSLFWKIHWSYSVISHHACPRIKTQFCHKVRLETTFFVTCVSAFWRSKTCNILPSIFSLFIPCVLQVFPTIYAIRYIFDWPSLRPWNWIIGATGHLVFDLTVCEYVCCMWQTFNIGNNLWTKTDCHFHICLLDKKKSVDSQVNDRDLYFWKLGLCSRRSHKCFINRSCHVCVLLTLHINGW